MYRLFHIIIGFLYILPSVFIDIYTEPYYTKVDLIYEFINPRNILIGVIWSIVHFVIYNIFIRIKPSNKISIYFPIKVMIVFGIAYYINSLRSDLTFIHTNHPGFYILMISIIFWILVSYIIYILFYALHTKNNFSFVKRFLFKKMLMYVVIVFLICCTTELIKNEIYTFKYGEPFKNADLHINMMGDEEYFKVLDYSDDMAYIYYVSDEMSSASIVCFRYIDN